MVARAELAACSGHESERPPLLEAETLKCPRLLKSRVPVVKLDEPVMKKPKQEVIRRSGVAYARLLPWTAFLSVLLLSPLLLGAAIPIGEIDPLTGKLAEHGTEIHQGIQCAVSEVNSMGGIDGRTVELISRDDQSQPEVAINQAEELIYRGKVVGLVGGYVDSLVGPISEIAAKNRTPYVASASLQRSLTLNHHNPYFFRVSRLDGIVSPLCRFIEEVLHPKRVGILFSATPGSTEFAGDTRARLEKSGILVPLYEKFRPGYPDFASFLLKARDSKIDVLISGGFFPDHLILVRQIREMKIPLKAYVGPWGVAYSRFIEEMGPASENLFGMCAWNPGITLPGTEVESRRFEEHYFKRFGKQPSTTAMHGYASARALLMAMENAARKGGALTGESVCSELKSLDLILPMEHLVFDGNGDPKDYRQVVVQIQKGGLVPVYPASRATGTAIYPMNGRGEEHER
jgi:branched-chain amino acid transport system substrate-binding protein